MSYIGQGLPADSFQGFTTDSFTGDGSATTFTLSKKPFDESALLVVINNVVQKPTTNFTVSGTTLTIVGTAVASGDVIYATHIGGALPIGQAVSVDLNGASDQLILDADADTTISADTDDQIDIKIGGTDVVTLTNSSLALKGTTPTLTIGDGGAEDTKIVFDGNAQNFYMGLDDSADDLLIGLGSTVGTTPAIAINENNKVTLPDGQMEIIIDGNFDNLILTSTDADANSGPNLRLYRNSASPAVGDNLGQIDFEGRNDNSEDVVYASMMARARDETDGTEDGGFQIDIMQGGTLRSLMKYYSDGSDQELSFNDDSRNVDFRVEGSSNTHSFFVDAGNDFVAVNASAQSGGERFAVNTPSNQKVAVLDCSSSSLANQMMLLAAARVGSSAYNFIQCMSDSTSGQDSEFIFTGNGNAFADGTFANNGADYAEFFETNDGNGIDVGKTVVLDGNKVRASTSSDDASTIIGVVRPKGDGINSMIIGNTAWNSWTNKYLHDDYGRFIMEDYSVTEWVVNTYENGTDNTRSYETDKIPEDVTVPDNAVVKTQQRKKFNPAYDKDIEYKPRSERDEWVIIGMLGQIQVAKGQKTGDRWIKMRDISDTVEEWLVR